MRTRTAGLCCICIGIGMLLTIVVPVLSWIGIIAIGLIFMGWKCLTRR